MGKVTALKTDGVGRRIKVFVDGSLLFIVDKKVIAKAGLQLGQDLSVSQIEELKRTFLLQNCLDAALHYLSYRPRSESEIRQRLNQRGFGNNLINIVIDTLKERGLVDDVAFARFWKDNRLLFSPRSRRLVQHELRQKGVSAEMADEVTSGSDDESSAYKAGVRKMRGLTSADYDEFCRRLFGYLRRRGFSYEVAGRVIERLWLARPTNSK